jgi:hypothetical protein
VKRERWVTLGYVHALEPFRSSNITLSSLRRA